MIITHDALDLTTQGIPLCRALSVSPWICSNLFNLDLTVQVIQDMVKHIVGKRVVGILLVYFLVLIFSLFSVGDY